MTKYYVAKKYSDTSLVINYVCSKREDAFTLAGIYSENEGADYIVLSQETL